jgi:hypothetical protein
MIAFSSRPHMLSDIAGKLKAPALISALHVLPFMIMEVVNRRNLPEGFPIPLFVFMWLLGLTLLALVMPILRSLATGNRAMANPSLLLRGVFLILIASVWATLVADQMPCFLGVPNCD